MDQRIAVVGLGYVGLPVALAIAKRFSGTIGFDINARRVETLRRGIDHTREVAPEDLEATSLTITNDPNVLGQANFFIVAVPTPIDERHCPDLRPLLGATETVGRVLRPGSVVVFESTVYPGVTEDVCGPLLAKTSGLRQSVDFKLGYSPERINPGDKEHTFEKIVKVVSGEDPATLEQVANVYAAVVSAGVHRAPSIKVAEAAKAIENIQRDLNISLMNELALIFDRIGIRTKDVLEAAATKWNFLRFEPGLVGGHCIGVDPYYMTTLAEQVGYHPQVILAGRRVNETMGPFIAQRLVKMLAVADVPIRSARVGILGLSFKQDVPDLRNTKVIDIVTELQQYGIQAMVHDPVVEAEEAHEEYGIRLQPWGELVELDALILAAPHREFLQMPPAELLRPLRKGGILMDVKSALDPRQVPNTYSYWSL
jgi:UDP-N-acetyl-D-glucosamine/UDP-N-acetyl-D-galactosamine dehydrogenase